MRYSQRTLSSKNIFLQMSQIISILDLYLFILTSFKSKILKILLIRRIKLILLNFICCYNLRMKNDWWRRNQFVSYQVFIRHSKVCCHMIYETTIDSRSFHLKYNIFSPFSLLRFIKRKKLYCKCSATSKAKLIAKYVEIIIYLSLRCMYMMYTVLF